jgi:hypothetical protein
MSTLPGWQRTWKCQDCKWDGGATTPTECCACDSCGGDMVCSVCWDYPEFCECAPVSSPDTSAGPQTVLDSDDKAAR